MTSLNCIWAIEPQAFNRMVGELPARVRLAGGLPRGARQEDGEPAERSIRVVGGVAIIPINGVMKKMPDVFSLLFGAASTTFVRQSIETALANDDVKTILLAIDSPGGTVDGLAELGDTVFKARETKPVIAQVNGTAASAAYYVASQATKVFMGRMDMVGSIGARLMLYDFSRAFENEGIKPVVIDTGTFKSAGAMGTVITEEQQAEFQRVVDAFFDDFVSAVARGRGITRPAVRKIADGRMLFADAAMPAGLVDGVRTFDETLARLAVKPKRTASRRLAASVAVARARAVE